MRLSESQYDWVKIPTDLNPKNMVMITAKTPHPTFHRGDSKFPVRLFTTQELLEASRSLAHRAIGLNHLGLIEGAFTIDAQYNPSTMNTEALCYFPDEWIDKVRTLLHEGKESIFSITYTWRDEHYTESGVEFLGLIFDQVDLLCGAPAGDKHVSARLVESDVIYRRARTEASVEFIGADKLQQSNYKPENDETFFKHHKECECSECHTLKECAGNLDECKHKGKCECKECKVDLPEKTNLLSNSPQQAISNQDPPTVGSPVPNVASAGFVQDNKGFMGAEPKKGNPDVNLSYVGNDKKMECDNPVNEGLNKVDAPSKAKSSYVNGKECEKLVESATDPKGVAPIQAAVPIVELTKVESKVEAVPKEEAKKEPEKQSASTPEVPKTESKPDTKLVEAEKKLSESAVTIAQLQTEKAALDTRVKELEPVVNKLQEAAKTIEGTTKLAIEQARKEGKEEMIKRVQKVLPANSMVSGNLQGCYRVLTNDIKKVLHEAENL